MDLKQVKISIYLMLTFVFLVPCTGFNQIIDSQDSLNEKLRIAAREIMTAAETCALITIDQEGRPRVRVMDPFAPESNFTVWFGTNPKSRKVGQIKKDPKVTLYYLDSDASGYVMIHGNAQIVNDLEEKEKRWKVEWEAFYPNKSEDYLLIKVSPEWMEVISYTRGIAGDPTTWEPPKVFFNSN